MPLAILADNSPQDMRATMKAVKAFWLEYAGLMAERQTTIWLWLVYGVLIGPTWLVTRAAGKSLFPRPGADGSYWVTRPVMRHDLAEMRKLG